MKLLLLITLLISNAQASDLKLIGKSLFEVTFFKIDVYEISYYKGSNDVQEIHLDYKRDVELKHSVKGWNLSLKHMTKKNPLLKEKINWILSHTSDYTKGDRVTLRKQADDVSIIKNNVLIASIKDKGVASIIHEPWIGEKPITKQIKNELLGK